MSPLLGSQQVFWDWRAAMNWIFGGIGSGFLVWFWLLSLAGGTAPAVQAWMNFVGGGVIAVGLAFVFWKIGRKARFWRAVSRPQTSWMTRELYAVVIFGAAVLLGLVRPHLLVFAITGLGAAAFLVCQAMILWRARGIPAWRHPTIPALVIASGLFEGLGLASLVLVAADIAGNRLIASLSPVALLGVLAAATSLAYWRAYVATAEEHGVGARARGVLQDVDRVLVPVGQIAPAVLFALAFVVGDGFIGSAALVLAGVLAMAGGAHWKFQVITAAGHTQGFAMARLPQRGSGTRAAPARLGEAAAALRAAP